MSKVTAILIAGLFAAGAHAQNPAGMNADQGNAFYSKPQQAAEARKAKRAQKPTQSQLRQRSTGVAGTAIPSGKSVEAGEARAQQRDANHPSHPKAMQGGTPPN